MCRYEYSIRTLMNVAVSNAIFKEGELRTVAQYKPYDTLVLWLF